MSGGRMEDRVRGVELARKRVGQSLFVEGWVEALALRARTCAASTG